jgi:hypothetical protein
VTKKITSQGRRDIAGAIKSLRGTGMSKEAMRAVFPTRQAVKEYVGGYAKASSRVRSTASSKAAQTKASAKADTGSAKSSSRSEAARKANATRKAKGKR